MENELQPEKKKLNKGKMRKSTRNVTATGRLEAKELQIIGQSPLPSKHETLVAFLLQVCKLSLPLSSLSHYLSLHPFGVTPIEDAKQVKQQTRYTERREIIKDTPLGLSGSASIYACSSATLCWE